MKRWMAGWLLVMGAWVMCVSPMARGATYYVDCNYGSNGNAGTSPQAAWRTPLAVTLHSAIGTFQPGDGIYFKRDCTWYEGVSLTSSGTSASHIYVDSYNRDGSASGVTNGGRPPHLTGYLPIGNAYWSAYAGNLWVTKPLFDDNGSGGDNCPNDGGNCVACPTMGILYSCLSQPLEQMAAVRFGTVWGNGSFPGGTASGGAASIAGLAHDRDWFFDPTTQLLYVYCAECGAGVKPADVYGQVVPIVSPTTMLNLNGAQYVEAQHLLIDWFTGYGVQVQGASDHLWLANMAANSEVENGTTPLGFYVQATGTPTDIHLYNTDANMNYVGYLFNGCAGGGCAFEIKNCRAYGNREYGIIDNVQGAVSYDFCHLYGNNLATALPVDTSGTPGPIAGAHNVPAETPAWVREWRRWPAYTTVSYDDPGLVQYSDTYIRSLLPIMSSRHIPLSIAVVTGGTYSQAIVSEVQGWINAGWDVNAHSISHEYWKPPAASCGASGPYPVPCHAFESLQYTGTKATGVQLTISHSQSVCGAGKQACLMVTTSPDDPAADITWNLTPAAPGQTPTGLDTLGGILYTLEQRGVFAVNLDTNAKSTARSISLADVTSLDILSSPQTLDLDETLLEQEEMSWAQGWMNFNFTGLPATRVYVMPGTYEDAATENIAAGLGYAGVRGTGSLKPCCGANTTLANGYDVYNILSQGSVPNYQGLSYVAMRNRVSQDLFKNALWGRPIGYFWHVNELRPDEVENFMDALVEGGAALKSNTGMVSFLLSCTANDQAPAGYVAGSYYVCPSNGVEADFRPTANSPVRDAGASLDAKYQYDLMGVNQNSYGTKWEIGAYAYVPESVSAVH